MDAAVDWLLSSDEPAIRRLAKRDLLDDDDPRDAARVLDGPRARALLDGLDDARHPYAKWGGAHWRLVSLVELGAPAGDERLVRGAGRVLDWLTGDGHRSRIPEIAGRVRRCASQEGNALAVACRLGLADDPRAELLARSLVDWQWPDGGWNCDRKPNAWRSSFNESLAPAWGLREYALATGARWADDAAQRTAELLLEHRVFRSLRTGEPINPTVVKLRWPAYWHYGVLHALVVLGRLGRAGDARTEDAVELVAARRKDDGRWWPDGYWWKAPGSGGSNVEVVDWGRSRPSELLTLNALRALRAAGG